MLEGYFNTAVDFIKKHIPTKTYKIGGITVGQESIISEGGYGYVYLAHDKENYDQKYALK
jgi:predicted transcriptional regulator